MEYRRFGKTNKQLSVITLGGMRFKHSWEGERTQIPEDTLQQCFDTVKMAFDAGINHIETAWGYNKSESVYGRVLYQELNLPRNSYYLMTKGHEFTSDKMLSMIEKQLKHLQTETLDFYGWHGINNDEILKSITKTGGAIETLLKLKEEGVIKHVGFSTHGPTKTIIDAINTDLFEFVNLHYYYFNQQNFEAVRRAEQNDMGVFIISPNDKGGQLFKAPEKVRKATAPLTPIQWNARFILQNKAIHTLSFGMTEKEHFDEMKGIFPVEIPWNTENEKSKQLLDSFVNDDPFAHFDGLSMLNDPSGINIPEMLRLRKLWKCYEMEEYGKYRYKVLKNNGHWFPGEYPIKENLDKLDMSKVPENIPLKEMLAETHKKLYTPPQFKLAKKITQKVKKISARIKS